MKTKYTMFNYENSFKQKTNGTKIYLFNLDKPTAAELQHLFGGWFTPSKIN